VKTEGICPVTTRSDVKTEEFYFWTCGACGAKQAMTREAENIYRQNHATFYCVHGHQRAWNAGESEEDKLRRERDQLRQRIAYKDDMIREAEERAEHERRRANGYKGHATKITKRAKAGVCPCCNRTFKQLAQHMANKHPHFTPLELEDRPPEGVTVQ
jgi:ribosomal protein L37AE/L43A